MHVMVEGLCGIQIMVPLDDLVLVVKPEPFRPFFFEYSAGVSGLMSPVSEGEYERLMEMIKVSKVSKVPKKKHPRNDINDNLYRVEV